jgi:hypothetical protein
VWQFVGTQGAAVSALSAPAPVPGAYGGHVYQTNTVIPPDIRFILSADGRSITGLHTSAPPSSSMYPDCGGGGFSIAGNQYGFPAPVISVHADGTFAGSATSGANTTVITGHFTDGTLVAEGTIHLVGAPIPGQSSCPVNATFKAGRVVRCADAPGDGDKVTRWTPVVKCALTLLDQPTTGTNVAAVLALIRLESGGLPTAIGPATGDLSGSAGLTQLTDKTFMEYASPALSANILDPLANIYAALNWALHNGRDISSIGTGILADPQQVINPKLAACPDEPGGGDVITRWAPVVQCALSLLEQAQTDTNVNAVLMVIRKDSGGDPSCESSRHTKPIRSDPTPAGHLPGVCRSGAVCQPIRSPRQCVRGPALHLGERHFHRQHRECLLAFIRIEHAVCED